MAKNALRLRAIQLRVEQRLSLRAIGDMLRVSKGSLSAWLKEFPLTDEEIVTRYKAAGSAAAGTTHRPPSVIGTDLLFSGPTSSKYLRSAAVGRTIDWFMSRGYITSIPVEQTSYDLIVESDSGLKRVQVKTTNRKDRYGRWFAAIHKRVYDKTKPLNSSGKRRRVAYTDSEVDVFFIITGDRDVYVIPIDAVNGKKVITLSRSYATYKRGVA